MPAIYIRLITIILVISFISFYSGTQTVLADGDSENLIWKPYLQQLTATGVIILWTTHTGVNSTVRYTTDATYSTVAIGTSRPLSELETQLHRVELTGLQPNTTYHYKIYTEGEDLLSEETLSFKTAPHTGSITPFTFLAFGDYGKGSDTQERLRDQMLLDSFDFILTTGDNAYSRGTYGQFDETVFQLYGDIFKQAAIFPTLGNHDYQTDDGAPYLDLFDLPANAWRPSDVERYYSFDYGNAHFVALDSNIPLKADDEAASDDMFDWLRDDLSQTTQPWIIVAFHHAAYSSSHKHGSNSKVQAKLVPIFEEYGVDLVLNGHDHIYQRSKPLREGQETTVAEGGVVYMVSGAGHEAGYACSTASWSVIEYCSESYGLYTRITINGSNLTVEAIDDYGLLKDYYVIEDDTLALVPIEDVLVDGSTVGAIQTDYTFLATVSPINTTLPVTYTWQATGQAPITQISDLHNTVIYAWPTTGTQTITVTAANIRRTVTDTHLLCLVQGNDELIEEVRQLDTNDAGLLNPAGLAYSFKANLFYVVTAASSGPTTTVSMLTPFEETLGSATVDASKIDPLNIAFDDLGERLFLLDSNTNQLIAIETGPNGILDTTSQAITRFEVGALGLQQPRGLTFDPDNGRLLILDSATLEIVQLEPDVQGGFDGTTALNQGRVSQIDLGANGLAKIHSLAWNPTNEHLYLVSPTEEKIYELSQTGLVINTLAMTPFGLVAPQGLVFGSSGDLTDDPAKINLYVADTGLSPELGAKNPTYHLPLTTKDDGKKRTVYRNPLHRVGAPLGRIVELTLASGCN